MMKITITSEQAPGLNGEWEVSGWDDGARTDDGVERVRIWLKRDKQPKKETINPTPAPNAES